MKPKYHAGQFVYIDQKANTIKEPDDLYFASGMHEYLGTIHRIKHVMNNAPNVRYSLENVEDTDGYVWVWAEQWLHPFEEEREFNIDEDILGELVMVGG